MLSTEICHPKARAKRAEGPYDRRHHHKRQKDHDDADTTQ